MILLNRVNNKLPGFSQQAMNVSCPYCDKDNTVEFTSTGNYSSYLQASIKKCRHCLQDYQTDNLIMHSIYEN